MNQGASGANWLARLFLRASCCLRFRLSAMNRQQLAGLPSYQLHLLKSALVCHLSVVSATHFHTSKFAL